MTTTGEIADFALDVSYDDLSEETRDALKRRVLDSVGIAVGAMGSETTEKIRTTVESMNDDGACRLWGSDRRASPPDAAMLNTALVRYLDYMDSYLAPGETPHPSDNVAAIVACGELVDASGEELLTAIGVAYEVQGELGYAAPVRDKGWDHVTHTVVSATAGAATILGLERDAFRNAVGIAATAHNALRVTRTGGINEWKGVASANAARNAVYSVLLARDGLEGPVDVFEGQKGWKQVVSGEFEVEYTPAERVHDVMAKKYVAETYAQSAIEAVIELTAEEDIDPTAIDAIRLDTFAGAKLIIGGGEGSRYEVETKAQADHSLPYMLAVAALDGEVTEAQYDTDRIREDDVQRLLRTVEVEEDPALTERFEAGEMPAVVELDVDGETHRIEKDAFPGHPRESMTWDQLEGKFEATTRDRYDDAHRDRLVDTVRTLDESDVSELVALLD
ncbi:2-methylcitrate dehydratase [Haloprofundus marisrubri]|uniref:2-methylcitrate dehydratase n=1 Tax=Haloprofundus marisrubri TaxID=1514971 RepID=A0A0W1R978_9EURY|nr:MmgE/PrpD family protein [Haloprofundus marisrubri]KTG10121.1 2-methylcitrate dehydratase [Haloprofundus marisrubri]